MLFQTVSDISSYIAMQQIIIQYNHTSLYFIFFFIFHKGDQRPNVIGKILEHLSSPEELFKYYPHRPEMVSFVD